MSRVTLLDGDHRKRPGLTAVNEAPNPFDFGDAGFLQLLPERRRTERYREVTRRRFERRRAEQDRIVAVVNALDLHDRRLADVGVGEIAGPFAEGTFFRHLCVFHRQNIAFEHDLCVRRQRQTGGGAAHHRHRRTLEVTGKLKFIDIRRQRHLRGEKNCGTLAQGDRRRQRFAGVPGALKGEPAMLAHVHLYRNMIFVLNHDSVSADVDRSRFKVFGDDAAACADVRPAVEIVPVGHRKLVQIDILPDHLIFQHGAAFQLIDGHGLVRRELFTPGIKIVDAVLFGNAHRRTGAFASTKYVGNNPKSGGIILKIVEQECRPFLIGSQLRQRAHFGFQIGALDAAQFAHLLQKLDVSSHVGHVSHYALHFLLRFIVWRRDRGVNHAEEPPAAVARSGACGYTI